MPGPSYPVPVPTSVGQNLAYTSYLNSIQQKSSFRQAAFKCRARHHAMQPRPRNQIQPSQLAARRITNCPSLPRGCPTFQPAPAPLSHCPMCYRDAGAPVGWPAPRPAVAAVGVPPRLFACMHGWHIFIRIDAGRRTDVTFPSDAGSARQRRCIACS